VHVAHTDDEFIEIAELERAVETYETIARKVLESATADSRRSADSRQLSAGS
jgi:hypothetical protein